MTAITIKASRNAVTETHKDVQNQIYKMAHKFHKQYGGAWDEVLSEANYYFLTAYASYKDGTAEFTTHCHWTMFYGFLSYYRNQRKRASRIEDAPIDVVEAKSRFDLKRLLTELSEDAQQVVTLIVDPPADVKYDAVAGKGLSNASSMKKAVRSFLQEIGWTADRMCNAFQEIQNAIA